MSASEDPDALIRLAAFDRLRHLSALQESALPWSAIQEGFTVAGCRILFATAAEGIFKPKEMSGALSLKTVVPKPNGRVWYEDQMSGDERVRSKADVLPYSFTGTSPEATRNVWLREAMNMCLPLIYFFGVAPGVYEPLFPIYVVDWDAVGLNVSLALSAAEDSQVPAWSLPDVNDRRYAMRPAKQRLHQAMFRQRVLDAYRGRCALSNLPEARLLDAAHIVPDGDEAQGQPDVRNGILMSRIHHSAYDSGLIGIDADYRVHVAHSLLAMHDGPILESIKQLRGNLIRVPRDLRFRPDKDRLAHRFSSFESDR